jgi:autotransporter-associated beta strand protein
MTVKSLTTTILTTLRALSTASLLCALSARAAVINWSAPATIAGDSDVDTSGTLVAACSLNTANVLINGVQFTQNPGTPGLTALTNAAGVTCFQLSVFTSHYAAFNGAAAPFNTLSANYQTLLASGIYGGSISGTRAIAVPVITAVNLTFGHRYEIQVWADDSRTGRAATNYATVFGAGGGNNVALYYNSIGALGGVGQYTIGTFVADGTTQSFSIMGSIASGMADTYLNAVQLRDLGPATFGIGYWNGLAGDNALNNASLNFCGNLDTDPVSSISFATLKTLQSACYFADSYYANSSPNSVTANNLAVGAGGVSIGTLTFANSTALTYTLTSSDATGITGTTVVNKSGNGTLILDGANTYSGGTVITAGTLQVGNGDANGSLSSGPVTNLAALVFNRSDSPTVNNVISGPGTLMWSGPGTLTLSGANTYAGATTISSGTLVINNSAAEALSGVISGVGALQQIGSGLLTLTAANTYGGGTTIGAGSTIQLNAVAGAGTGTIAINGNGILHTTVAGTYANAITGGSTSVINVDEPAGNTFLSGDLSGFSGKINCGVATTTGQLVINNSTFAISSAASWVLANGATLDLATPFTVDPASVVINGVGNNQAYGSLRLDACDQQGNVLLNGPNCLIGDGNTANGTSTISGVISDGGHGYGFTKVGAAASPTTIILSAANTYSGPTIINDGTLALSGSGSIANPSAISLANGTTFDVSGVNGGTYSLGAGKTLATLGGSATINGTLDVSSGSPLSFLYDTANTPLIVNGTLNLNNNPVTVTLTSGAAFASGTMVPLISGVSGTVAASTLTMNLPPNSKYTAGNAPTLSISGGILYLTIHSPVIVSYNPYTYSNLFIFAQGIPPVLSLTAQGSPAPVYQWYSNGVAVAGATGTSYTNVQGTLPVGRLTNSCVASSSAGSSTNSWVLNVISTNGYPPYPLAVMQTTNASGATAPPIAYWRLDESDMGGGNLGRPCNDWVGGNIGAYTNVNLGLGSYSPTLDPTDLSAQFGIFAASGSLANIPISPSINMGAASGTTVNLTVEAWINAAQQTVADAAVVSLGTFGNNDAVVLAVNSGGSAATRYLRFYVRNAVGTVVTTTSANITPNGTWQHLVGVCDETHGTVSLYINGVQSGTSAGIGTTAGLHQVGAASPLLIGNETSTTGVGQWKGQIDEVALYNYALTPAQIAAHYNAKGTPPTITMLTVTNVDYGAPLTLAPTSELGTLPLYHSWSDTNSPQTVLATTPALTIPSAISDKYILVVTNAYPPASTNSVVVNAIQGAPSFASPGFNIIPSSRMVYAGIPVTFSVLAHGTYPLSYQWYNAAGAISGATGTSFTTSAPVGTNTYYCVVNNGVLPAATSSTGTLIGLALPTNPYVQAVLKSNPPPIAFWRLGESAANNNTDGNNGVVAYDYIGGHNATYNGVNLQQPGYNPSDPDSAAQFGVFANPDSYAGEVNNASVGISNIDFAKSQVLGNAEFSVEAWVNSSVSQISGAGIVARGWSGGGEQFSLDCNGDQYRFYIRGGNNSTPTAQSSVVDNDGLWHHLVGVCDQLNGTARLYVDGVLAGAAYNGGGFGVTDPSGATDPATDLVSIGARAAAKSATTLDNQFVGTIDEVALYDYALNATQVATHYAAGTNVIIMPTISAALSGTDLVITYTGTLASSTNAAGPITNIVAGATSPYTVPATNAQMFFRSRIP